MSTGELTNAASRLHEAPPRARDLRRRAFEANLSLALDRQLNGDLPLKDMELLVQALGAAHQKTRHMIDARTRVNFFGIKRYFVLQAGVTWKRRGDGQADASPFARRLFADLPQEIKDQFVEKLSDIAAAIDMAEITRRHPIDRRWQGGVGPARAYAVLIGGPDRRSMASAVSHERRAPANETIGFFILLFIAALVATLGAVLIVATVVGLANLLSDETGRAQFFRMLSAIYSGDS